MVKEMFGMFDFLKQRKQRVDRNRLIGNERFVVIDTELTGLDEKKDSIVSIGALRMVGGRIDLGDSFYRLVNPDTKLTAESVIIHGITPSDVVEKPEIETVLNEFLEFCGDNIIVGHCISIDLGFINRDMKRLFDTTMKNPAVDTVMMYDFIRHRMPSHGSFVSPPRDFNKLYDIAKSLGVPVSGAHNAMMDSFITAQVFQKIIPILHETGVRSTADLLKINSKGGDRFGAFCGSVNL